MCGIAGIMTRKGAPSEKSLETLQRALSHRGPDDQGIKIEGAMGLVHTRLSIIDLAHGHQPLEDDQGNTLIVNGEIYNHVEIREAYPDYPFKTATDCEPIFPLYHRYGEEVVPHLRGMFGLALYNSKTQELVLVRDPFGIKPLYYVEGENEFAFASEAQALMQLDFVKPIVHPQSRTELLELRYTTGREIPLASIKRVLPGETLVIKEGKILKRCRYDVFPKGGPGEMTADKALKEFETVLSESIRVHLRSDVPYGLFLSGGLDSATVLALMSRHTDQPIKTFTVGFSGSEIHDERAQARKLAEHFKTDHTEIDIQEKDFWKIMPRLVEKMDDPIVDPAILPTYVLGEVARKSVKVVLSGEGGDEMFGGYRRYQKAWLPGWLGGRIIRRRGTFEKKGLTSAHLENWNQGLRGVQAQLMASGRTNLQVAQRVDLETWVPNDLLIKLDRCLMAHGVEGRTPFLDPEVAAFAFKLPDRLKVRRGYGKWVMRQWIDQNLPLAAPFAKKRGFSVPVSEWIAGKGSRIASLVANQPGIEEVFDRSDVRNLFTDPSKNRDFTAWSLLFYGLWHQIHVLKKPVVDDTLSMLSL